MKKLLYITLLFLSFQAHSQIQSYYQIQNHSFQLGFLMGGTAHLGASGWGYHANYTYQFSPLFSASAGFGQLHGKTTEGGRSRGSIGGTTTWDNSYQLESTEGYNFVEFNAFYSYANIRDLIDLKVGTGVTLLSNWLNYNKDVDIVRGIIVSGEKARRRDNLGFVNLMLDTDFRLNDQLFVNWKLILRKTIYEQEPFTIVQTFGGTGTATTTSRIDVLGAMVIGLGYRF